jgi:ankyrin repeat protein
MYLMKKDVGRMK